jgi:hypothetical protein
VKDDNDLALMARGYMDCAGLLSEIASLVGVHGVITANDLLDGVRAVVAERQDLRSQVGRLRDELEEERHQVGVEASETDRVEMVLTAEIERLRSELKALRGGE